MAAAEQTPPPAAVPSPGSATKGAAPPRSEDTKPKKEKKEKKDKKEQKEKKKKEKKEKKEKPSDAPAVQAEP